MILYALEPCRLDEQDDMKILTEYINFEPKTVETLFNIAGDITHSILHCLEPFYMC